MRACWILNTGINFPPPCYRGRSTVTAFSFDEHRPLYRGNAIFILQGKTRMLRPRMLMVSKDRNENEERIKLCSNHREFRLCDDSFLHRGFAHSLVKRKSYRRACKINIKIKHRFTRSKTFLRIEEGVSLKISSDLV